MAGLIQGTRQARFGRTIRLHKRRAALVCAVTAVSSVPAAVSLAATKTWTAGTGNWNTPANWGGINPAAGDTVNIFNTLAVGTPTITYDGSGSPSGTLSFLNIDGTNAGFVTLSQTGGFLSTSTEYVGQNGSGRLNLSGGTHTASNFFIVAFNPNSSGTVNVSAGVLSPFSVTIGDDAGARGMFIQTGGVVTVTNTLTLGGFSSASTGTYSLSGNSMLSVGGDAVIGGVGVGVFNQSNGTVAFNAGDSSAFNLGNSSTATGVYNLSGGTLTATNGTTVIGVAGSGTVNQTGGVATYNNFNMGGSTVGQTSSVGIYNLSGTGTLTTNNVETIGYYGSGTFNQSGGTHVVKNGMVIGLQASSTGNYNLSGGLLSVTNTSTTLGYGGQGTFSQSNGTATFGSFFSGYALNEVTGPFGTGTVNLNGGLFSVLNQEDVGFFGSGTFNQNGGTHTATVLQLGAFAGSGTYTLNTGALIAGTENIGVAAGGTFNQNGGTHTVTGNLTLGPGGFAYYTLSNGSLLSVGGNEIIADGGTATFFQFGGVHTVSGAMQVGASINDGIGFFSLEGGSLTANSITVGANGTFDGSGGTLFANTFTLNGGVITGLLQNQGLFVYNSGTFAGRLLNQGTVRLPSSSTFAFGIENDATIALSPGQSVTLNGVVGLDNFGTFSLAASTISGTAVQINDIGGLLNGYGTINPPLMNLGTLAPSGLLQLDNSLTNAGNVSLASGSSLHVTGAISSTGAITSTGGAIVASSLLTNGGVITVAPGGGISGGGSILNTTGATIQGGGGITVPISNSGSIIANSSSPLLLSNLTTNGATAQIKVADNSTLTLFSPLSSSGIIQLLGPGASLGGVAITNFGTIKGVGTVNNAVTNNGILRAQGGELDFSAPISSNPAIGQIQIPANATIGFLAGLANNAGSIDLTGGTFDNKNQPLTNTGSILGNGTLYTGGLVNNGTVALATLSSYVYGPVTNNGSVNITSANATFFGFFNNVSGTVKTTFAIASYLGGMSIGGTYHSDPSTQLFTDLTIMPNGALQGGVGDVFIVSGSYTSSSSNAANWNTQNALLHLSGGATHNVLVNAPGGTPYTWGQFLIDAPDTAVLAGSGGGFVATSTTNSGSIQQPSGVATLGVLTGNGSLSVGGAAAPASLTVTSFSQSSVTVADQGQLIVSPNASTKFTNSASSFTITGSGQLNLANHDLLVNTPSNTNQIRQYLVAGYNTGNWNGTGGISSSSAAADTNRARALGYAAGSDGIVAGLAANQTLVRSTIYGDADLNGRVQAADFNLLSAHFNQRNATWDIGDFDYNGRVQAADFNLLSAHFNQRVSSGSPNVGTPGIKQTASPSAGSSGNPAAGTLEIDVEQATGDVKIVANNVSVLSYDLESNNNGGNGDFDPSKWQKITGTDANGHAFTQSLSSTPFELQHGVLGTANAVLLNGTYDLGLILPAGMTPQQYVNDLADPTDPAGEASNGSSSYGLQNGATVQAPVFVIVPEPAIIGLTGLVAIGLRRRGRRSLTGRH